MLVRVPSSEIVQEKQLMSPDKDKEDAECGAEPRGENQDQQRQKVVRVDQM